MAYRIRVEDGAGSLRIEFQGTLDCAALAEIASIASAACFELPRREVSLVLEKGTEVDAECIEPLRRLEGVAVRPVSAFLERWLAAR
jgi:hypothetical protein